MGSMRPSLIQDASHNLGNLGHTGTEILGRRRSPSAKVDGSEGWCLRGELDWTFDRRKPAADKLQGGDIGHIRQ